MTRLATYDIYNRRQTALVGVIVLIKVNGQPIKTFKSQVACGQLQRLEQTVSF